MADVEKVLVADEAFHRADGRTHFPVRDGLFRVQVYTADGLEYGYYVISERKAKDHAAQIIKDGFRWWTQKEGLFWFPAHQIRAIRLPDCGPWRETWHGRNERPREGARETEILMEERS